ncbi:hypothetical protein ZWY2020_049907 [Hordeum vulgare]|nr:hypothetical protein ZWY2020_049907 [Hordeum vulgare]
MPWGAPSWHPETSCNSIVSMCVYLWARGSQSVLHSRFIRNIMFNYAGFINGSIATSLSSGLQPTCPGPHQFPPLMEPSTAAIHGSYLARRFARTWGGRWRCSWLVRLWSRPPILLLEASPRCIDCIK